MQKKTIMIKNQLTKLVTVFKKNYCNIQGNLSQKF